MGNGSSSRRNNGRIQHNPVGYHVPARMTAPQPPGYPPSQPPHSGNPMYMPNSPFYYPQNYNQGPVPYPYFPPSNGQFMMHYQQQFRNPPAPPSNPGTAAESQKANLVRNHVNIKKATLRLEKDEENPGKHLVAFTFDASLPGWFSIFFLAQEKGACAFSPMKPHVYGVSRISFQNGFVQKFQQSPGSGVNLSMLDERDLSKEGENDVYTLVVRAETLGENPPTDFCLDDPLPVGDTLPKYIHCQTTHAVIEKKDNGDYKVRVVKQNIWIEGHRYELQEIYGIENTGGAIDYDGNDSAKECVICMSEPRDTTVLPCRHMCMCSDCAKVLKFQTNRCPICRTPVERLLEIKVPRIEDNFDHGGSIDTHGSSASQSSAAYPAVGQSSGGSSEGGARPEDKTKNLQSVLRNEESGSL